MDSIAFDLGTGLTLIPAGAPERAVDFYSWEEMERVLDRFLATFDIDSPEVVWEDPEDRATGGAVQAIVQLVPRPDNDYNPNAISVAAPPVFGASAIMRHMGFLSDRTLERYGSHNFQAAAEVAGAIGCHALVHIGHDWETDELKPTEVSLLLPTPEEFQRVVADYLAAQPPAEGGFLKTAMHGMLLGEFLASISAAMEHRAWTGQWGRPTPRTRMRERIDARALRRVSEWADYRQRPATATGLAVQLRSVFGTRRVYVVDAAGARVAQWHSPSLVTLTDERLREAGHVALQQAGYEVPAIGSGLDYPNAYVAPQQGSWQIQAIDDAAYARGPEVVGTYSPSTGILSVRSAHYRGPLLTLIRRHGEEPRRVPLKPPSLEEEWVEVRNGSAPAGHSGELRTDVSEHLPPDLVSLAPFRWVDEKELILTPSAREMERDSYYTREIQTLFGEHERTKKVEYCRLCGSHALGAARVGEEGAQPLAYCMGCLRRAQRGVFSDVGFDEAWMDLATWAISELAASEFGGAPSLRQLQSLSTTKDASQADKAVLLRMFVPRPRKISDITPGQQRAPLTWADWLQRSGLLDGGLDTFRGCISIAADGHKCRSLLERHIDDFMTANGIAHVVEPHYPYDPELNTSGLRADWLLEDGTFIEAWGLPDDAEYAAKIERKTTLADRTGLRVVGMTANDLDRLPDIFNEWLA